jgi:two-component system sensor histidine kinase CpxA
MVAFDTPVDNAHFIAVAVLPTRAIPPPPFFWWQFVVAMAVSALSCLLLTRHFVGPVRKLQHCTEAFGRGDLDARPDPVLLKRNDELGDLSKTIGQMAARISKLLSSQKNFLIQVSHELGSPLTRLNLALALARRKAGPALIPELDRIQQESAELNSMVQQLLRLARLESGLEWEGEESYSLRELMEEVCYDNQLIADQTGKQLLLLSSPSIQMWGYRELLKRALDNVLRNAVRFTPEGSRVAVNVESSPDGQTVLVQVRDGGEGVQHDKLDAIFEPFVRGSSERSGAGLGLAIAKRAVLANRGTIRAMNLREGGLLVEISLPCTPSDPVAVPQADAVETSSAE